MGGQEKPDNYLGQGQGEAYDVKTFSSDVVEGYTPPTLSRDGGFGAFESSKQRNLDRLNAPTPPDRSRRPKRSPRHVDYNVPSMLIAPVPRKTQAGTVRSRIG
jgi:hypothetical protein